MARTAVELVETPVTSVDAGFDQGNQRLGVVH